MFEGLTESLNENKSVKILGFSNENEYNFLLNYLYKYINDKPSLIVDNGFKIPSDVTAIQSVQASLKTMNLNNLIQEDITLSNNTVLNEKIKQAVVKYLQPKLLEPFPSSMAKNNFFVLHIVWLYERINEVSWDKGMPILLYYGDTNSDDELHLLMLKEIGIQIVYINPRIDKQSRWSKAFETEETFEFPGVAVPQEFMTRVRKGESASIPQEQDTNVIQTVASQAKTELQNGLYQNSAVFHPWQFKNGSTVPMYINAVVEDIKTYWEQDARFREGFDVEGINHDLVRVPNFFTKINGVYFDKVAYKDLVLLTKDSQLTLFKTSTELVQKTFAKEDMFSLMFTKEFDEVQFDKVKEHKLYQLQRINQDVQRFIIRKYNEFVTLFKDKVQQIDLLELLACIINSDVEYIKLIENFDFPYRVPKLVIYLSDRQSFDIYNSLFLHFLNHVGIDIIIYSPTGSDSIEEYLFGQYLNVITLEEMDYDLTYEKLLTYNKLSDKKGFFKRLFS